MAIEPIFLGRFVVSFRIRNRFPQLTTNRFWWSWRRDNQFFFVSGLPFGASIIIKADASGVSCGPHIYGRPNCSYVIGDFPEHFSCLFLFLLKGKAPSVSRKGAHVNWNLLAEVFGRTACRSFYFYFVRLVMVDKQLARRWMERAAMSKLLWKSSQG